MAGVRLFYAPYGNFQQGLCIYCVEKLENIFISHLIQRMLSIFYLFHYDKLDTNIHDFEAKLPSSATETLNTNPSQSIKSENVHHLHACLHQ